MADLIDLNTTQSIDYSDFLEELKSFDHKLFDDEHIEKTAILLKRLYNNRTFLTNYFNEILKDVGSQAWNLYTFQVFMLAKEKYFNLRAPIWMPPRGQESDAAFVYDLPHDHNFDLMTLGYLGSGYKTDIYQYDSKNTIGYPTEKVNISKPTRYQLSPGKILFMQANKDIHTQIPPRDLSISFNIMKSYDLTNKQFIFNLKKKEITRKVNDEVGPLFFNLAAKLGDQNTLDIVQNLSKAFKGKFTAEKEKCMTEILARECN